MIPNKTIQSVLGKRTPDTYLQLGRQIDQFSQPLNKLNLPIAKFCPSRKYYYIPNIGHCNSLRYTIKADGIIFAFTTVV